jgi:hypothetical protein
MSWRSAALLVLLCALLHNPFPEAASGAIAVLLAMGVCFAAAAMLVPAADRERLLALFGLAGAGVAAVVLVAGSVGVHGRPLGDLGQVVTWLLLPCGVALAGLFPCAPRGRASGWTVFWFCVLAPCGAAIAVWGALETQLIALGAGLGLIAVWWQAVHRTRLAPERRRSIAAWSGVAALFCVAGHALVRPPLDEPGLLVGAAALLGLACPAPPVGVSGAAVLATRSSLTALALSLVYALGIGLRAGEGPSDEPDLTARFRSEARVVTALAEPGVRTLRSEAPPARDGPTGSPPR